MKTIWKYQLELNDKQFLNLPKGAEILAVQNQKETVCIWAMVNSEVLETEERCFEIFGTGHEIPCDMGIDRKYIGTFQMENGLLVFHLFERIN